MERSKVINLFERKETNGAQSLANQTDLLERLFGLLNACYYDSELLQPKITAVTKEELPIYGCFALNKIQTAEGVKVSYEICVCVEMHEGKILSICHTLLHEMAHLYNAYRGIRDYYSGGVHNEQFRAVAEAHGLIADEGPDYGYAYTHLHPMARKQLNNPRIKMIGSWLFG